MFRHATKRDFLFLDLQAYTHVVHDGGLSLRPPAGLGQLEFQRLEFGRPAAMPRCCGAARDGQRTEVVENKKTCLVSINMLCSIVDSCCILLGKRWTSIDVGYCLERP